MLPSLAALVCLMLCRYLYYDQILPNTFFAKIGTNILIMTFLKEHSIALLNYSRVFLKEQFLCGTLLFFLIPGIWVVRVKKHHVTLWLMMLALLFFIWFSGGDWMDFSRFFVHLLPIAVLLTFIGADMVFNQIKSDYVNCITWIVLLAVILVFNVTSLKSGYDRLNHNRDINPAMISNQHIAIGKFLKTVSKPGDRVVVNEIGAIGYYSELHIVDMLGLVHAEVAQIIGCRSLGEYADCIMSEQPDYILLNNRQKPTDQDIHPLHKILLLRIMQHGGYKLTHQFPLNHYKELMLFTLED